MSEPTARHTGAAPSFGVNVYEATGAVVGALSELLPFEALGRKYYRLMFWVENAGTSDVTMRVSSSERGVYPDAEFYESVIQPGQTGHVDMLNTVFQFWELTAHSNPTDGYPDTAVTWGVVGVYRQWGANQ